MVLKKNAKPRRRKMEIIRAKQEKDEEDRHIRYLLDAEAKLSGKRMKIEDALTAVSENENMVKFMKEKGLLDENGALKAA